MSGEKQESILHKIAVPIIVGIVIGGTNPWWFNRFFPGNQQLPKADTSPSSSQVNDGESPSPVDSQNPPEMTLTTGSYAVESGGSLFNGSGRYIATAGNKTCIATIDAEPSPYEGYSKITVSRILWGNNGFYININPTPKPFVIRSRTSFNEGETSRFTWSLQQARIIEPYETFLNDCLQSNDDGYEFSKIHDFREGIPFYGSQ